LSPTLRRLLSPTASTSPSLKPQTPTASIVIPTRARPDYLKVALASIAPQAAAAGAELLVVEDDRPTPEVRALAERFGAGYRAHERPHGLNAARNTGVACSRGELVVFVDDDVEVRPGWLRALLAAARAHPHVEVFTGPIRPRLEGRGGWSTRSCGREGPPITSLDLGPDDTDRLRFAWGANMAVRRAALERVGPFDTALAGCGDEQEWQERLFAEHRNGAPPGGGLNADPPDTQPYADPPGTDGDSRASPSADRPSAGQSTILYVAAAALDHRRSPADARLRALACAARVRGRASRHYDAWRGEEPAPRGELRTLAGCLGHVVRRRCPAGLTMVAHSLGRVEQCARERLGPAHRPTRHSAGRPTEPHAATQPATEDFLTGESGTVGGLDKVRREVHDRAVDARELLAGRRLRLARAARRAPARRRVLVLGVERPERRALTSAIRAELARSRHDVELHLGPPGELGRFENLNRLLAGAGMELESSPAGGAPNDGEPASAGRQEGIERYDWLLTIDDDVVLPRGFLDNLLFLAERLDFQLVQPAHRARSHAAWRVTRRRAGVVARQTPFVEIGPVTAFARATFAKLLPFPDVRMGWGLDLRWAALARERGWHCGVLDAVAILHAAAPAGDAYSREAAVADARALLATQPYLTAAEAQTTIRTHHRW
jgi:Glycosyl transferase family 2